MAEEVKTGAKFHNIILENRGRLNVSGVEDVDSFDEGAVIIFTNMGVLTVRGEDLHINKFSVESGELFVEGNIYALTYSDDSMKKSGSGGFFSQDVPLTAVTVSWKEAVYGNFSPTTAVDIPVLDCIRSRARCVLRFVPRLAPDFYTILRIRVSTGYSVLGGKRRRYVHVYVLV